MHLQAPATALDATFPAQPAHLPAIRRAVTDAATGFGADEAVLLRLALAVSEAATNAILHAYRDRPDSPGDVRVMVRRAGEQLDVCIHDRGMGMAPRTDSPGLGLGLCLIAHEAAAFEVRDAAGGGTEIALRFELASATN